MTAPSLNQQRYAQFRSLWKVEDEDWLDQRKDEWEIIRRNYAARYRPPWSASERQYLARFFVSGEETSEDILARKSHYRLLFTPFESVQQVATLCEWFTPKANLVTHAEVACHVYAGLPHVRPRVALFLAGCWGRDYEAWLSRLDRWARQSMDSEGDRRFAVEAFATQSLFWLSGELALDYCYTLDSIPFFMSTLRYMDSRGELRSEYVLRLVDCVSKPPGGALSAMRQELVDGLRAAFSGDDAPDWVRQHYLGAGGQG